MQIVSLWNEEIKKDNYSKLNENIEVDVLIIGGGITGLSTAYHLINKNLKVCVVEKNKIASGVSSKTTGKLTYLQDLMYSKITDKYSIEVAKKYYYSQREAIKIVEDIINENKIDCDYTKQKSYLFADYKNDILKVKREKEILESYGVKITEGKLPINIDNFYSFSVSDTAYFHPVKYLVSLAKICFNNGINIFENTSILDIKKENNNFICYTKDHRIKACKVVIASHYPFFLIPFLFPLKGYTERSYISAIKVKNNYNISGINVSKNTVSFRYYNNDNDKDKYLIYLNNSHNLAFKYNVKENFNYLINDLEKMKLKPDYIWSNEDIITNDYLPYIGLLEDNFYLATGYNTWGMTNGSIAGKVISDLILYNKSKYKELFSPRRNMPFSNIMSVLYDSFSSAKPLIENKIIKNKNYYSDNIIFTKRNGENIAIYIDSNNKKHIVYNRCPHLKCSLIFNEIEKTWDCPCHSSRFDVDGNVIKGPSNYNISYKKDS